MVKQIELRFACLLTFRINELILAFSYPETNNQVNPVDQSSNVLPVEIKERETAAAEDEKSTTSRKPNQTFFLLVL